MRDTISIRLPPSVREELEQVVKEEGLTRNDLVRRALDDYLFNRKFGRIRAVLMAEAQAKGIHTDEDVFRLM